jgi:hypothetical protein
VETPDSLVVAALPVRRAELRVRAVFAPLVDGSDSLVVESIPVRRAVVKVVLAVFKKTIIEYIGDVDI